MPNSLNPEQTQHFVRPNLVPNCLQRLSVEDMSHHKREFKKSLQAVIYIYHGSEIMTCNKIDKPLVVYRFSGSVMTSITTLCT